MKSNDKGDIASVVASLGILADSRNWDHLVDIFTATVRVDYTSLFGGAAEQKPAREIVDGWAAFLPRFSGTQHLIGTPCIEVNNDRATAEAPVTASHFLGNALKDPSDCWVVGGHYGVELQRIGEQWLISALTLKALWQEGAPPA